MKNVTIMGVHQFLWQINILVCSFFLFRGGRSQKIYVGNCLKRGAWTICRGLGKNREEGVFEGGWYLEAHYDLILVHAGT